MMWRDPGMANAGFRLHTGGAWVPPAGRRQNLVDAAVPSSVDDFHHFIAFEEGAHTVIEQ